MKRKKKEAAFSVSQRLLYLPTFVLFNMKVTRKTIRFGICKWAVYRFRDRIIEITRMQGIAPQEATMKRKSCLLGQSATPLSPNVRSVHYEGN